MQRMSAVRWFAKCGFSAAICYSLAACDRLVRHGLQLPATTTRDGTLITLNRYAKEPIPDVVLVGSSLTFRLKEEYFATSRLAIWRLPEVPRSPGWRSWRTNRAFPNIVLVEANVLSRAIDTALVERYSSDGNAEPLFFRPIRTAVAAYENWLHAPLSHAQVSLALSRLLEQPPSDFDNRVYVDRALQQFNAEDPTVAVRINVNSIEQLIAGSNEGARECCCLSFPIRSA